jgi:uncharacterized membrane protein YbhN (UPF0104 family)
MTSGGTSLAPGADSAPSSTLPQEALGARPGPRSVLFKVLSGVLSGGLLVLLFAAIIPKVAEFDSVWESLAELRPRAVVLLLVLALANRFLLAQAYTVLTPGLSLRRSLVGVVEIAYSAVYLAVLGDGAHDAVVAGVLLYRALTYLLPIVTGAVAYLAWRLMRRREEHAAAHTSDAPSAAAT